MPVSRLMAMTSSSSRSCVTIGTRIPNGRSGTARCRLERLIPGMGEQVAVHVAVAGNTSAEVIKGSGAALTGESQAVGEARVAEETADPRGQGDRVTRRDEDPAHTVLDCFW